MNDALSESEALVLDALEPSAALPIEVLLDRVPQLTWHQVFEALARLRRRGIVGLHRHGFSYTVSKPSLPISA